MPSAPGRDRELWDPGAQPERTYQAWTRTGLAFTVCALFATRLAGRAGVLAVVLSIAGATAAWLLVSRQKRRLHSAQIRSDPTAVVTMTVLTVLLATGALLLVFLAARG
jgi:uncharacterized membrane protein YidH (DUF202 family)